MRIIFRNYSELLALIILLFSLCLLFNVKIIDVTPLTLNIKNGQVYIFMPGLFSLKILLVLVILFLIFLLFKNLRNAIMLLIFLWPMLIIANLFVHNMTIYDIPRIDLALAKLIASKGLSLEHAHHISFYYGFPFTWILVSVTEIVLNLDIGLITLFLSILIYFLYGIIIVVITKRILSRLSIHKRKNQLCFIFPLLLYSSLSLSKIFHYSPQQYALLFLIMLFYFDLNNVKYKWSELFILIAFSSSIILSHPITSIILTIYVLIRLLSEIKNYFATKKLKSVTEFITLFSIETIFIIWFIYKNVDFLKWIYMEATKSNLSIPAPMIFSRANYFADRFYRLLYMYRYIDILILYSLATVGFFIIYKRKKDVAIRMLIWIVSASSIASLYLFARKFFFSAFRIFYILDILIVPLVVYLFLENVEKRKQIKSIKRLSPRFAKFKSPLIFGVILLFSILIHSTLIEFIARDGAPQFIETSYEASYYIFVSKYFYENNNGVWHMSSRHVIRGAFYSILLGHNKNIFLDLTPYILSSHTKADYLKLLRGIKTFVISPVEEYVLMENGLAMDFFVINNIIEKKFNRLYDNTLYILHSSSIAND